MAVSRTSLVPDDLTGVALLLDFDGTLVDIAPTPDSVIVPDSLRSDLARLCDRLDGALAIISGRPIAELDSQLAPLRLAAAGEHGAEIRPAPDAASLRPPLPELPESWRAAAAGWEKSHPGLLIEQKHAGLVVHYRRAPALGDWLRAALEEMVGDSTTHEILRAACAWEIRARGVDKGRAVRHLMQGATFRDRRPLFIGDDVTDEDAIAAAEALGGTGLRVPEAFGDAAGVRAWLARVAAQ